MFDKSIKALKMLNEVGYGMEGTGLTLNLVYNPSGAFLPPAQAGLEQQFKRKLKKDFGIEEPRIAVLGLNPHAGDDGLLGEEEEEVIIPALEALNNNKN